MSPARWFGRWRKQKPAAPRFETRLSIHSVVTTMRSQVIQGRTISAPIGYICPWDTAGERDRFNRMLRIEDHLPHPQRFNEDEKKVAAESPLLNFGAILAEPVIGLGSRLHMGRN